MTFSRQLAKAEAVVCCLLTLSLCRRMAFKICCCWQWREGMHGTNWLTRGLRLSADTESKPQPTGVGSSSSSHSSPQQAPSEAQTEDASPSSPHTNTHNGLSSRPGNHTTHKVRTCFPWPESCVYYTRADRQLGSLSLESVHKSSVCLLWLL